MFSARVQDEMSQRAVCVKPDDHLHHAFALMKRTGFRHLPVVDANGELVGMLSDRDILRLGAIRNDELVIGNRPVSDIMSQGVWTCKMGDRLGDIAEEMVRRRIDALPVTNDQGHVIGIITSTDLLLFVRRMQGVLDVGAMQETMVLRQDD